MTTPRRFPAVNAFATWISARFTTTSCAMSRCTSNFIANSLLRQVCAIFLVLLAHVLEDFRIGLQNVREGDVS